MMTLRERIDSTEATASESLTLTFDQRRRSRLRAKLDSGDEVALVLPRGLVLREGDRLKADSGVIVAVRARPEQLSTARSNDPRLLARACYHLGNRHVPVEVGDGWARYQHDHVLDEMVLQLGLQVQVEDVAFEPESGAYGGGGHGHEASHGHGHGDDEGPAHDH
jgi:urease accessory protein